MARFGTKLQVIGILAGLLGAASDCRREQCATADEGDEAAALQLRVPEQHQRIIGGTLADADQYPSYVSLRAVYRTRTPEGEDENVCGATLIAKDWIITALHCQGALSYFNETNPNRTPMTYLGEAAVRIDNEGAYAARIKIEKSWPCPWSLELLPPDHPPVLQPDPHSATAHKGKKATDCVLAKLSEDATKYGAVPVPLYRSGLKPIGASVTMVGTGLTESSGGLPSKYLMELTTVVAENSDCASPIEGPFYFVNDTYVCVGRGEINQRSGMTDSGGPLYFTSPSGETELAGVVSGGVSTRGDDGSFANKNFTRFMWLASVAPWVERTMQENS